MIRFVAALFAAFWLCGCTTNHISYQMPVQLPQLPEGRLHGAESRVAAQLLNYKIFVKPGCNWEKVADLHDYKIRVQHLPNGIVIIDNGHDYPDHRHRLIFYNNPGYNRKLPVKVVGYNAFGNFEKEEIYGNR